jgi:hypothetical protein
MYLSKEVLASSRAHSVFFNFGHNDTERMAQQLEGFLHACLAQFAPDALRFLRGKQDRGIYVNNGHTAEFHGNRLFAICSHHRLSYSYNPSLLTPLLCKLARQCKVAVTIGGAGFNHSALVPFVK